MADEPKVPKLRFPNFEGEWEEIRLGDVAQFSKGKGISKADIDPNGGTPCIRYGELYTIYSEVIEHPISKTSLPTRELVFSEGGEVIIPASGEAAIDIATASSVEKAGIALGGDLNIIRGEFSSQFIAYLLSHKQRLKIARLAQGNSVVHLYKNQIASLKFGCPAQIEQQKVADFLLKIDQQIALQLRRKEALEAYKKGMMQGLFSSELRFTRHDGRPFPDWQEKRLGEIFEERSERDSQLSELLSVTLRNGVQRLVDLDRVDNSSADKSNYKVVKVDDIAYNSMRMWQGASGLSAHDGIVSPAYTVVTCKVGYSPLFWAYYFKYPNLVHLFQRYSQGLTSDTWNLKFPALSSIKTWVPSEIEEQQKIADYLFALDTKIDAVASQIDAMQRFKKGLLQQMFV